MSQSNLSYKTKVKEDREELKTTPIARRTLPISNNLDFAKIKAGEHEGLTRIPSKYSFPSFLSEKQSFTFSEEISNKLDLSEIKKPNHSKAEEL